MAYFYYLFALIIFVVGFLPYNLGGNLADWCLYLWYYFIPVWLLVVVAGVLIYRRLPLLVVIAMPFLVKGMSGYTQNAIFYSLRQPHYERLVKDLEEKDIECVKPDQTEQDWLQCVNASEMRSPFSNKVVIRKIKDSSDSGALIISFSVGKIGDGMGEHWGNVYCSNGKNMDAQQIAAIVGGKMRRLNDKWYYWEF